MEIRELNKEKESFFAERIAMIRRHNSGFIKAGDNDLIQPEEADRLGIEHEVYLDFQLHYLQ